MKTYELIKANALLALTILGVILGFVFGLFGRHLELSGDTIELISYPGELFIRMLKMLVLPLIISSLITGMAHLDARCSGRLGSMALMYYVLTTIMAIIVGIAVVTIIHPGQVTDKEQAQNTVNTDNGTRVSTMDSLMDIGRNLFPDNLVTACIQQARTMYIPTTDPNGNVIMGKTFGTRDGMNMIGLILFSLTFGLLVGKLGSDGETLIEFFGSLNEIIMQMVGLVMWLSPVGIVGLIAGRIMSVADLEKPMSQLGLYILTVMTGLTIHSFITLPFIYFCTTRRNPFKFSVGMLEAMATAFATASSSATLPVTFRCLEENNGIDKRVTRFIASIGATVNMDGSALYEAVSVIFIAQMNGIPLGFGDLLTLSITTTLASIGAASLPGSALVSMVMILSTLGLPISDIPILLTVDWFLDRVRTAINVLGDGFGAGIIYHMNIRELNKMTTRRMSVLADIDEQIIINGPGARPLLRRMSTVSDWNAHDSSISQSRTAPKSCDRLLLRRI